MSLHPGLMTAGYLTQVEGINARGESWKPIFERLVSDGRATRISAAGSAKTIYWVATERRNELRTIWTGSASREAAGREDAIREALRGRLAIVGPSTAKTLAASMSVAVEEIDAALAALEREGIVLRGSFTPRSTEREWCDRRLLARIHRYTLNRLRAEIEPVSPADFMRFLFAWQRVDPEHRASGVEGLAAVITQLDGYELAASAWEADVLASRCEGYDPLMLDSLCLTGRVTWGRLSPPTRAGAGPSSTGPGRQT